MRGFLLAASIALATMVVGCGEEERANGTDPLRTWTAELGRLYSPDSPWNTPLPVDVEVHPRSAAMMEGVIASWRDRGFFLAVEEWTVPLAAASARPSDVRLDAGWAPRQRLSAVPLPVDAAPDPRDDGHLVVIDRDSGCEYDLWRARRGEDGRWAAAWGNTVSLDGDGIYPDGLSARASGFALAAGLVRPETLARGHIDHALVFAFPHTSPEHVSPATKSDGTSTAEWGMPMGTRLQLDPTLDLDSLDLTPSERSIAAALQRYGMILGDSGGALSLYAVHPSSYPADPYGGLLPAGPQVRLDGIPVDRMRVVVPDARSSADPGSCPRLSPRPGFQ